MSKVVADETGLELCPVLAEELVDGLVIILQGNPPRSLAMIVARVKVGEIARLV